MQLATSFLLLLSATATLVHARPIANVPRDINISHKSLVNGTTTTHSIDASVLPAELARAIEGSDININLTTDRRKRSPRGTTGVNNSTINLTVISSRRSVPLSYERLVEKRSPAQAQPQHHNIHIDASSNGQGGVGGIHNSTVNINLNSAAKKERRTVSLGDHSVIVDVSSSSSSDASDSTGIEDSTVHVNILPPRALSKSTGHHSIVVDSSSLASDDVSSTTKTGDHSAVVDTSSSGTGTTGIKGSTINLTVIAPAKQHDQVDAPIPSMAQVPKRSIDAFHDWSAKIQREYRSETDALAAAAEADAGLAVTRRNHSSHK
ncbi:uncharacterized protein JCM15063_006372 [Sporobolomyces koalae]|uniref:uncharacterized protein n=1 Tax=Sporobolomyces koalae TaxID=500713 RepID=UPI00317C3326